MSKAFENDMKYIAKAGKALGYRGPEADDGEKSQESIQLNQQCYLMQHWKKFCRAEHLREGFDGFTCLDGNPTELVQRLTSGIGREDFLDMDTAELALLVPKIKLFKVSLAPGQSRSSGPGEEIVFKTFYDDSTIKDMTASRRIRGDAVGLQELTYEFFDAGSKSTAAKRQKVILKFTGESIRALSEGNPSALELALQPSRQTKQGGKRVPNSEYYGLKVVYGWSVPTANQKLISSKVREALASSTQTLMLSLQGHTLSFKENGSVTLECEYQGYVETKLNEVERDILGESNKKITQQIARAKSDKKVSDEALQEIKTELAEFEAQDEKDQATDYFGVQDSSATTGKKEAQELETKRAEAAASELSALQALDKATKYRRILDALAKAGKIWFVDVDSTQLGVKRVARKSGLEYAAMAAKGRASYDASVAAEGKALGNSRSHALASGQNAMGGNYDLLGAAAALTNSAAARDGVGMGYSKTSSAKDAAVTRINYMYFGDILSVALQAAYSGSKIPIRFLVGSLSFRDHMTGKFEEVNIADIPISLSLFSEFWITKVVSKGKAAYTVAQFIHQAVRELIVAALGDDCWELAGRTNSSAGVTITTVNAAATQGGADPLGVAKRVNIKDIYPTPKSNLTGDAAFVGPRNHYEYLLIYSSQSSMKNLKGDREQDRKRGIYHLALGKDRGPLKKVDFEKSDLPNQETVAAQNTAAGALDRIASAYDAKLTMVGNSIFMPGNLLYIAPTSLGVSPAVASKIGLGGYYFVQKLSGQVDSSGWTCTIDGKRQGSGHQSRGGATTPAPAPEGYINYLGNPSNK